MRLERITPENLEAARALSVRPDQEHFVESVAEARGGVRLARLCPAKVDL